MVFVWWSVQLEDEKWQIVYLGCFMSRTELGEIYRSEGLLAAFYRREKPPCASTKLRTFCDFKYTPLL